LTRRDDARRRSRPNLCGQRPNLYVALARA
jgi:hypothetical protein